MTETMFVALVAGLSAAIPSTILAFAALTQARSAATKAKEAAEAAVVTANKVETKTDELVKQSEAIHVAVNSNLAAVKAELVRVTAQNEALQGMVSHLTRQEKPRKKES